MVGTSEELERLAGLRDRGVLTPDEFEAEKRKLLEGDKPGSVDQPKPKRRAAKGCGIIAAILLALILIGALFGNDRKSTTAGRATADTPTEAPVEATASELARAYKSNEAAAQNYYGSRPVLVTATVDGVALDFADKPFVKLRTDNEFLPAQARLVDVDESKAAGLTRGDKIKLLCNSVREVVGTPMLSDCSVR